MTQLAWFSWKSSAVAGEIPRGNRLPPVLPIVLYNGDKTWSAAKALEDLCEPDLAPQLLRYQPRVRYLLPEEHGCGDAELAGLRNVAAALFRLENSRRAEDIEPVLTTPVALRSTGKASRRSSALQDAFSQSGGGHGALGKYRTERTLGSFRRRWWPKYCRRTP